MKLPDGLTPIQAEIMNAALTAIVRAGSLRDRAGYNGLPVLSGFIEECRRVLEAGVDSQIRAFKETLISQTGKKVIDRESRQKRLIDG